MRNIKKITLIVTITLLIGLMYAFYSKNKYQKERFPIAEKPVIYLYPSEKLKVNVKLEFKGNFSVTYPAYRDGWTVIAHPDGKLLNLEDSREYSYLFWEGETRFQWQIREGFLVSRDRAENFLKEKLEYLGLVPREYNEFIVYWLPRMLKNSYNLVYFAGSDYENLASLEITPKPDSIIRVFMVLQGSSTQIDLPEQKLTQKKRSGFSVIEWGGTELGSL